ncbi:MAG: hypothetical protein AAGC68_14195, partial [Verrucomicrobiota bacterium]
GNEIEIAFFDEVSTVPLPDKPASETIRFPFDGRVPKDALAVNPTGSAPVYASVTIETFPEIAPMEPEQRGFSIQRRYDKVLADGSIAPAEDLTIGDLILITLDVNIPNQREAYLAIDDPLPSIFEAVNPSFKSQATQRVNTERRARTLYTNYREIRKDRVLFFADSVFREGDYSIQYLARVVAPGIVTAPPAKIEAMYEPQRFGLSGTETIEAKARVLGAGEIAWVAFKDRLRTLIDIVR